MTKRITDPKIRELLASFTMEHRYTIKKYGEKSLQARTAASRLYGARKMRALCEKIMRDQKYQIAYLCRCISDFIHHEMDEDMLETELANAIDDFPTAAIIMNWRDQLTAAERKIRNLECELERHKAK